MQEVRRKAGKVSALTCVCAAGAERVREGAASGRVSVQAPRPYAYVCVTDTHHGPESHGLGTSQAQRAPGSPVLAPSSRRPSRCGCSFPRGPWWSAGLWGKPFSSYLLPVHTAGAGGLQACLLPWLLLSGVKLVALEDAISLPDGQDTSY